MIVCGKVLHEVYHRNNVHTIIIISMIETSHHFELQWICVYLLCCWGSSASICTFSHNVEICLSIPLSSMVLCLRFSNRIAWMGDNCVCACAWNTAKPDDQWYIHLHNLSWKMCNYHIHIVRCQGRRRRMCRNWTDNSVDDDDVTNISIQTNVNIILWLHITNNTCAMRTYMYANVWICGCIRN